MNTFEMKTWGWSGECHIHSIPQDLYDHLAVCKYDPDWYGYDDREALYNLSDNNSDEHRLWELLGKNSDNFYWHEGDIFCGIRPTLSVFSIEVNDKELDLSKFGLDIPFPYKSECDMENEHDVSKEDYVPTIGFCSFEKGYQGSYTIETSDKEFDIDKVEVDRESITMRARMYYLRDRIGKEANKVREKRLYETKRKS